jgi:predicted AAA+ superfamily ATPase
MTVIMWIDRLLKERAETACTFRPVVLVAGARQTGKSSLLQRLLPAAAYVTLDRVIVAAEAEETPVIFLINLTDRRLSMKYSMLHLCCGS